MELKKIIIIVGIILASIGCIGGGIWAYFHFQSPEIFEFEPDLADNPKAQKGIDKNASAAENAEETLRREGALKLFLEFPYFRVPMIVVPVVRDGRVYAYLHLRIAMKATNRESFKKSKVLVPRLIDGIYSDLYKAFENLWNERFDPKTSVIKERIFAVAEKILGHGSIDTIHFREMVFKRVEQK